MNSIRLKDLRPCDLCASPVAGRTRGGTTLDFHRIVVERHLLDFGALRQHAGLAMMLGGREDLALALGSEPNATKPLLATELVICNPCWDQLDVLVEAVEARKGRVLEDALAQAGR